MKVQFEFSAGDLAEVADRAVSRSPVVQKWRAQSRLIWVLVVTVIVYRVARGEFFVRFGLALGAGCLLAAVLWRTARQNRGRLSVYYREQLGGDGPFQCEVEIDDTGVVTRQLGEESRRPWSQVVSVSETPGGIEVIYRPVGLLLVRERAFPDAQARAEFLALCRRFVPTGPENSTSRHY